MRDEKGEPHKGGKVHRYAPKYRPPMMGTVPVGFRLVEAPRVGQWRKDIPVSSRMFGVIEYDRPLSDDEVLNYELEVL